MKDHRSAIGRVLLLAILLVLLPAPFASQADSTVRYVGVDTPEMGFAQKIAHCILFMDERRIIEEGAPNTFFRYPRQGRARLFLRKIVVH